MLFYKFCKYTHSTQHQGFIIKSHIAKDSKIKKTILNNNLIIVFFNSGLAGSCCRRKITYFNDR